MEKERCIETGSVILGLVLLYSAYWTFGKGEALGKVLAHIF